MVICLERGADLHMAHLIPLPLNVSCFSKIQIGFTFLVPAHLGSPVKRAVKRVCVCYYNITSLLRACWSVYLDGLARFDAERVHQLEYLFVVLAGAGRVERRAA